MSKKTFQKKLQADIVELIALRPMSTTEVAGKLRTNYATTRKAMRILHEEGIIKPQVGNVMRDVKYMMGEDSGINNSIPKLYMGNGKKISLFFFAQAEEQMKNSMAVKAITRLPIHSLQIMITALRASNGDDVSTRMEIRREAMEKDREALANALDIYDQILNNPRNWAPEILKRYINDEDYDVDWINDRVQQDLEMSN